MDDFGVHLAFFDIFIADSKKLNVYLHSKRRDENL